MLNFFRSQDQLRCRALKKAGNPVMQEYLEGMFPDSRQPWNELEIVALDFETTGLDPVKDQILSYGKVHVKRGAIHLASADHQLIRTQKLIPESSAIIHHITDDLAESGLTVEEALPRILAFLRGKVMLVHFNKIEQGFLDTACRSLYGSPFIIPTIDTLMLAQRVLSARDYSVNPNRLRLFNLRDHFNLPSYKAHNALGDAITTAELFLVLESEITPNAATPLKELLIG